MLTKYGYNTIAFIAILCFVIIAIAIFVPQRWLQMTLVGFSLLIMAFTLNFFRDPERITPSDESKIYSPADGKVIVIKDVQDTRFIGGAATQISIFMSPLNVHVNRIPIAGRVDYLRYVKGKFVAAFEDKASAENEHSEIGLTTKYGKILFTQVAGYIARRIVYELKEGDSVAAGERFGMIKFGSRVDILAPPEFKPLVQLGEKVSAGETALFIHQ